MPSLPKFLIDEDTQKRSLVSQLKESFDILTVAELGLNGATDAVVFYEAMSLERVILSRNYLDFHLLHQSNPTHPGIIHIFPKRGNVQMKNDEIVLSLRNLVDSQIEIANEVHNLHHWNF